MEAPTTLGEQKKTPINLSMTNASRPKRLSRPDRPATSLSSCSSWQNRRFEPNNEKMNEWNVKKDETNFAKKKRQKNDDRWKSA